MQAGIAIIINGISRKKKKFYRDIYPVLSGSFPVEVFETQWAGHAVELAAMVGARGFSMIVAAGGDGTLNQVINGIQLSGNQPAVGLIPLGTGNDFARTCGLTADPQQLIRLIQEKKARPVDIGRVICHDGNGNKLTRYFINAASIGMGPEVVQRLASSSRRLGPGLTYWKAITATFLTHRPQEIHCRAGNWDWKGKARVLTIANGRSFGNALYIAPDAIIDDGLLDVFIAGELPLLKFLLYQQSLKSRKKIIDDKITYSTGTQILLSSSHACPIETEGELAGFLPAEIDVLPRKINFLR